MSARRKKPAKKKASPKKSAREQRLERALAKAKKALAAAKKKRAKPTKRPAKTKRQKPVVLPPQVQENLRAMKLATSETVREKARADVIEAGFVPVPDKTILVLAIERARRLRETPGKPKLDNIRHDARGFIVAEDENGETYRAYAVTNKAFRKTTVFFAKEEALEGYQSPFDFLDAYGRQTDDGEQVFGDETHDVAFRFDENEETGLPF